MHRRAQGGELADQLFRGDFGKVWNLADRLQSGEDICPRIGKKRVSIEKIRTAEHVVHRVRAGVILSGVKTHPLADGTELEIFLLRPRLIQSVGMVLPSLGLSQWLQDAVDRKTGEEMR